MTNCCVYRLNITLLDWLVSVTQTHYVQCEVWNESLNIIEVDLIIQSFTPETVWDLWKTKWHWDSFFPPPSMSVFSCQHHSTNAPYPFSSTRCSSKTDKRPKNGDRLKAVHFGNWVPLDINVNPLFCLQRVKYLKTYHVRVVGNWCFSVHKHHKVRSITWKKFQTLGYSLHKTDTKVIFVLWPL
jgi:hypothetical protein